MSTKLTRGLVAFLALAAVALFHAMLVSVLLALDFTGAADAITINNPDVAEAQAQKFRATAVAVDFTDVDFTATDEASSRVYADKLATRLQALESSLDYWHQAIAARPLWPYYHLGALDVEVLLQDKAAVQQRIKSIIALAPNERGLDKHFLILAFIAWDWVDAQEREWFLARLNTVKRSTLKLVYSYAKQADSHRDICMKLPWKKVRVLCKS